MGLFDGVGDTARCRIQWRRKRGRFDAATGKRADVALIVFSTRKEASDALERYDGSCGAAAFALVPPYANGCASRKMRERCRDGSLI